VHRIPGAPARAVIFVAAVTLAPGFAATGCGSPPRGTLTILAAASLAGPFEELADTLRARQSGLGVRLSFAGSHQLALQVEQGALADVVAVADPRWIERLAARGLLSEGSIAFAENRLVLATPVANPGRVWSLADLSRPGLRLLIGTAESPIGRYAREVLARHEAAGGPSGFTERALGNVVSEEQDVSAIVARLRLGEADAGFVYRSDLPPSGLRGVGIPDSINARVRCVAAAIAHAPNPAAARDWLHLLASPAGRRVFERHGFDPAALQRP